MPINVYQFLISPLIKPCCRFYPSCSQYAKVAIEYHGVIEGMWLAVKRVFRCHPWSNGGYDPVPHNDEKF